MKTLYAFAAFLFISSVSAQANCQTAETQMEINHCMYKEYKAADVKLNQAYQKVKALQDQKRDKQALKKAQRAWIRYRDLACTSYSLSAEGGSMQPMLHSQCLGTITRQRTKILREQIYGLGGNN